MYELYKKNRLSKMYKENTVSKVNNDIQQGIDVKGNTVDLKDALRSYMMSYKGGV